MYGYSSSSDSEDDYYNWRKWIKNPPPPNNSNDANKRKKKLKLPPQQSINRIWKRFSKKRFTKALAVLPFDPVPPPAIGERSNELLTAGYERAVEECRRKVRKIIQECRRVNTRYRDPGWDIVRTPVHSPKTSRYAHTSLPPPSPHTTCLLQVPAPLAAWTGRNSHRSSLAPRSFVFIYIYIYICICIYVYIIFFLKMNMANILSMSCRTGISRWRRATVSTAWAALSSILV